MGNAEQKAQAAIKKLALHHGFELEATENGNVDLNPRVYSFAMDLVGKDFISDSELRIGAQVKVISVDEVDRLISDIRVGYTGVLVKIGPAGYHSIYVNETGKLEILHPSQFKVEG